VGFLVLHVVTMLEIIANAIGEKDDYYGYNFVGLGVV